MNTTHGEWVQCKDCVHFEDCDTKEDRDGCYLGETERIARWKGAGMGDYYCSLCCETVSGDRELRCPKCNALMYTDKEYAEKKAWWALEDSLDNIWSDIEEKFKK